MFLGEKLSEFIHIKDADRKFQKNQVNFSELENDLICNDIELTVIEKIRNLHKSAHSIELEQ